MPTIRSFIAVEIDKINKQKISELIAQLKESNADVKWVSEDQMHLTLKFLGNTEQDKIQKVACILKSIADDFSAFSIKFSNIGAFPNTSRPRVIWMGIKDGSEILESFNNRIEAGLVKLGFEQESRQYKAHLTLGRVRSLKNIPQLVKSIKEIERNYQYNNIRIDRIILFQTTLTPKGAIYTSLAQFMLK